MPDLSNNSFIPKRGPSKRKRSDASKKVYLFTLGSYVFMFATILAAGGVYLYGGYVDRQMNTEIAALNTEISGFNDVDMQKVITFDSRLSQAAARLNTSVSLVSVFSALEAATIGTVKIDSFEMERDSDNELVLAVGVQTDSFDSTIFQRGIFEQNDTIQSVIISEVSNDLSTDETGTDTDAALTSIVRFNAELSVPLSAVPYVANRGVDNSIIITEPAQNVLPEPEPDTVLNEETL